MGSYNCSCRGFRWRTRMRSIRHCSPSYNSWRIYEIYYTNVGVFSLFSRIKASKAKFVWLWTMSLPVTSLSSDDSVFGFALDITVLVSVPLRFKFCTKFGHGDESGCWMIWLLWPCGLDFVRGEPVFWLHEGFRFEAVVGLVFSSDSLELCLTWICPINGKGDKIQQDKQANYGTTAKNFGEGVRESTTRHLPKILTFIIM